jgi:hypothetical protein
MKSYRITIEVLLEDDTNPSKWIPQSINEQLEDTEGILSFECDELDYNGE